MYAIGYDLGSSSIKAALVDILTNKVVLVAQSPASEMKIDAPKLQWAEQDPNLWWEHICKATKKLISESKINPAEVISLGIAYQMHGLVAVDKNQKVVRPSIIWCDSRAIEIGEQAFEKLGHSFCLSHYLNSPGNFTASKLAWVKENEPENFKRIDKIMLPGDFIAMKMSGITNTTITGLSEGILWDFKNDSIANDLMIHYGFNLDILPEITNNFEKQVSLSASAASELGLKEGTPITYRAGDQPNNAMSLGVNNSGQIAATGGTSGVVYGIVDSPLYDNLSRVNGFAHVNHTKEENRIGILLCINGAGSQHRFLKELIGPDQDYHNIEEEASKIEIGSNGLLIYPFGNGAERMLEHSNKGAEFKNIDFNIHKKAHFFRAGLEGISYSFAYGINIMKEMGMELNSMKAGDDNLFQSDIFSQTLSNICGLEISLIHTTGAVGAAKASAFGVGKYHSLDEAFESQELVKNFIPNKEAEVQKEKYKEWVDNI